MITALSRECQNCRFFDLMPPPPGDPQNLKAPVPMAMGFCLRYPPVSQLLLMPDGRGRPTVSNNNNFPVVALDQKACGEFQFPLPLVIGGSNDGG